MATAAAAFQQHELVPDILTKGPSGVLTVKYAGNVGVNLGAELTPRQVKDAPVQVTWNAADPSALYTLIMTDPDAPSRATPMMRECLHWFVANIPGGDLAKGDVLATYGGAGPPDGTGLHRYVFILWRQPPGVRVEGYPKLGDTAADIPGRLKFSSEKFAEKHGLGVPVAGNFFQAAYDDYVPELHKKLGFGQ